MMRRCMVLGLLLLVGSVLPAQDTVRVRADKPPLWGANVRLTRELVIGSDDDPPDQALGQIWRMVVRRDGSFFTFDGADHLVRRYDPRGRLLGSVGRKGQGPGEYGYPTLLLHGDSLLLIADPDNGRMSIYTTEGKYLRQFRFPRPPFREDRAFGVDAAGRIYCAVSVGVSAQEGTGVPTQYLRLRLDGSIIDSVARPRSDTQRPFVLMTSDGPRWSFPDQWISSPSPGGGIVAARSRQPAAVISSDDGVMRIERPYTAVSLRGAERDEWEAFVRFFDRRNGPRQDPIPDTKPFLRDVFTDSDGRLWLHLYVAATKRRIPPRPASQPAPLLTMREPNTFDVVSPRGEYLGRVVLPFDTILMAVQGQRIWTLHEPGGEAQRIIVYRLEPESRRRQ